MRKAEPAALTAVFLDDKPEEDEKLFGRRCTEDTLVVPSEDIPLTIRSETDPNRLLSQLSQGELRADALLIDVDFCDSPASSLAMGDPPHNKDKKKWGLSVLRTVKRMDPDITVLMLTGVAGQEIPFLAGRFGADEFISKSELVHAAKKAKEQSNPALLQRPLETMSLRLHKARSMLHQRPTYDHDHLSVANAFASTYDPDERKRIATVAYYHYENSLIDRAVSRALACVDGGRRLRVLDMGCGTGRIEESLIRRSDRDRIEVVAVDFSGDMLKKAVAKLSGLPGCKTYVGVSANEADQGDLQVSLYRAPVEAVDFLKERYQDGFDLAILGFGFLSYVNYGMALPTAIEKSPGTGIVPILRDGAEMLFSVYNENAVTYDRIRRLQDPDDEMPIAAVMDLNKGRLRVSKYFIACEAFTITRIMRFLSQSGLRVDPEDVTTFPTSHLMVRNVADADQFPPDSEFPTGRFSEEAFALDLRLSRVLGDRGHYIVGIAKKTGAFGTGAEEE